MKEFTISEREFMPKALKAISGSSGIFIDSSDSLLKTFLTTVGMANVIAIGKALFNDEEPSEKEIN